ncbi:MAG: hypothetical protein AAF409_13775 [Pseudomonadota bacterium]
MASTADLLQGLTDLRLPEPGAAELVLALGLGLALAGVIGGLTQVFRQRPAQVPFATRIEETRTLAPPHRTVALAVLLRELTDRTAPGPQPWTERAATTFGLDHAVRAALAEGLYRPGFALDPEALEDSVRRAARRAGA